MQGKITVKQLDLASLASVKALADDLAACLPRLDTLMLNAGVMACPKTQTKDGFEMQVGASSRGAGELPGELTCRGATGHLCVCGCPHQTS